MQRFGSSDHGRRTLVVALASIAAIFLGQAVVSTRWTADANRDTRRFAEESITSVELVTRIQHDVDAERLLVGEHIREQDEQQMAYVEAELEQVDGDLDEAIGAYRRLVDTPLETSAWQLLTSHLPRVRTAIARAIELSKKNLDGEARAAMSNVRGDFPQVEAVVSDLVDINHAAVRAAAAYQRDRERAVGQAVLVTQLAGLLGLVLVGWWGFRRIANEQRQRSEVRALEARNEELDAFAGRIAHDLRNPLSTIVATTDLVSPAIPPEKQPMIERLHRSSRRIEALITDLLALSRAGVAADGARANPAVAVANMAETFRERYGDEASLRVDVEPSDVPYSETLLQQAVWNIVENGVKYRRAEVRPEIVITGHVTGGRYVLRVADNGMGMSEEEVARAFEPFYRASRTRAIGGTGLGLAIVKRVVEARGGTISIESQLEQGTTLVLSLPLDHR